MNPQTSFKQSLCLVTGASGFIGHHIVSLLIQEGAKVRVLVRPTSNTCHLDPLPVEKKVGDLNDIHSLHSAMEGVDYLFHVAGCVAFKKKDLPRLRQINVQGVKNTLGVAQDEKLKRVVLTSSIAAIGGSLSKESIDETFPWNPSIMHSPYAQSKYDGEMEAVKYYREGLPVVVVNPSLVIGAPDYGPSVGGQFILSYLNRRFKGYLTTGINCVDVKDVAQGHLLAALKGRLGERYILSNENLMLIDLFKRLEACSGIRAPRLHIPYSLAYGAATLIEGAGHLIGKEFLITREQVQARKYYSFYSHQKATEELGFHPRPFQETLQETVTYFQDQVKK